MCKEDIRLARAASAGSTVSKTPAAARSMALPANANRYSLSAHLTGPIDTTGTYGCLVYARVGDADYPILGLSADHPADSVTLDDIGSIVREQIFIVALEALKISNVVIAETQFTTDLEKI